MNVSGSTVTVLVHIKSVSCVSHRRKMNCASCKFIIFALLFYSTEQASNQKDAANYIVSLIQHLAASETGVPKCVFFGFSVRRPFGEVVEQILQSPLLDHVTKHIVTSSAKRIPEELPTLPQLMIIDVGDFFSEGPGIAESETLVNPLSMTDPTTKVLVLLNTEPVELTMMHTISKFMSFSRVVYMDVENRRIIYGYRHQTVEGSYLPDPKELYPDTFRYVEGGEISACAILTTRLYPEVEWVFQTANMLNATAHSFEIGKCDINLRKRRYSKLSHNNLILFDILITTTLDTLVILVPRDRLNIFELFMLPFDWGVWFVVIFFLVLSEALWFFFPSLLRNDPILLVVCGFGKFNLNKANSWVKICLNSLIVLIFFTTCAYETKIVALMIDRPFTPAINTFDELLSSGIQIQGKADLFGTSIKNTRLSQIFLNTSTTNDLTQMDGVHAEIGWREVAILLKPLFFDESNQHVTYNIMQEPFQVVPRAFQLERRNPLRPVLAYSNQVFVESGIFAMWYDRFFAKALETLRAKFNTRNRIDEKLKSLNLGSIAPAWIALGVGVLASCVIFIGEVVVKLFARVWNKEGNKIPSIEKAIELAILPVRVTMGNEGENGPETENISNCHISENIVDIGENSEAFDMVHISTHPEKKLFPTDTQFSAQIFVQLLFKNTMKQHSRSVGQPRGPTST